MKSLVVSAALAGALLASSCAPITLAWADLTPDGPPASPPVLGEFNGDGGVATLEAWRETRAPMLIEALERYEFGVMPEASSTEILNKRILDEQAFGGAGRLEEWTLAASAEFDGVAVETNSVMESGGFFIQVVTPADAEGPVPVVIMETFCPWWDVMPHPDVSRPEDSDSMSGGLLGSVATYVFGRYICSPPIETILARGYAIVSTSPSAVIPDRREAGLAELRRLSAGHDDDATRWGAVAAWGWLYSRMADALEADPRFDKDAMTVWGHSRYAKAALWAAATDARIDAVIAHQSGTGGASLNRGKPGESVKSMTNNYPHWFAETYADYAGREDEMPIDQHQLLALIAPRPILLGNARRDVWSDPTGAFRAADAASAVWRLHGGEGLDQSRLDVWKPGADIAFWIRPGTHGVVEEDWPAFLEFLDAQFPQRAAPVATSSG